MDLFLFLFKIMGILELVIILFFLLFLFWVFVLEPESEEQTRKIKRELREMNIRMEEEKYLYNTLYNSDKVREKKNRK